MNECIRHRLICPGCPSRSRADSALSKTLLAAVTRSPKASLGRGAICPRTRGDEQEDGRSTAPWGCWARMVVLQPQLQDHLALALWRQRFGGGAVDRLSQVRRERLLHRARSFVSRRVHGRRTNPRTCPWRKEPYHGGCRRMFSRRFRSLQARSLTTALAETSGAAA
jgi:hypothetical protein